MKVVLGLGEHRGPILKQLLLMKHIVIWTALVEGATEEMKLGREDQNT